MDRCKLYNLFLDNNMTAHKYKITLKNGNTVVGIPTADSVVDLTDENVCFTINRSRIKFSDVVSAEKI